MSNQDKTLSAANIRYLLTLNELDDGEAGVRSTQLAECLGVTKPSVHTMIKKFCEKGYTTKEKYEAVHLTSFGRQLAAKLSSCFDLLYGRVQGSLGLPPEDCRNAICAVLAQACENDLDILYEKLTAQDTSLILSAMGG